MHTRSRPKILIVEAVEGLAELYEDYLSLLGDFETVTVPTCEEGKEVVMNDPPDLTIVDTGMKDKHSAEVCRELKENERTSHIKVVAVTGYFRFDMEQHKRVLASGVDEYLEKPYGMDQMKYIVDRHLPWVLAQS